MIEYLELQFRIANRRFRDAGIAPVLAYLLLCLLFLVLSFALFSKIKFANYIYVLFALILVGNFSETKRNEFLRLCFNWRKSRLIRLMENSLLLLPFLIFLIYKQLFFSALTLFVLLVLLAMVSFRTSIIFTVPTPFSKRPFEFSVGFRNTFYIALALLILTVIAAIVNNFDLGRVSMIVTFGLAASYHLKPEHEYYIWVHSLNVDRFLLNKFRTAVAYTFVLALPTGLILAISFYENINTLLSLMLLAWLIQVCIIVCKYSAYPNELGLKELSILGLCILFPPLLLVVVPYFLLHAKKSLSRLLK